MSFSDHTLILKNDGTLWGCGLNNHGQLGLGQDTTNKTVLTKITTNTNDIESVYCGYSHTIILKNDNTLWACGWNEYGQLGLGDTSDRTTFTRIVTNTDNIKSVHCGYGHTIILKNDNTLWACGRNDYGQLGLGDKSNRNTFTQININSENIKSIYCGGTHTIISKNDGTLWGCGYNGDNRLGLENTSDKTTFTQITTNTDNIKSVYCGRGNTFILKNNGTLWGCGRNDYGQLGLGDTTSRPTFAIIGINTNDTKLVSCGCDHTIILKNDSILWGSGDNQYGQLGLENTPNKTFFTIIGINTNDIKSIYCGYYYTLILKNDGTLWTCGYNGHGELGLGDTNNRTVLTQITENGDNVKCLANNYSSPSIIKIYDTKIGYVETLDTNNFRNIPIDTIERLKSLCINPLNTHLNCLISFDKKQTWKAFNGTNWNTISDISPENIIVNGMEVNGLNSLDKSKLISGGFIGDLDFKVVMKTNDTSKTPSIAKIYIEYK